MTENGDRKNGVKRMERKIKSELTKKNWMSKIVIKQVSYVLLELKIIISYKIKNWKNNNK